MHWRRHRSCRRPSRYSCQHRRRCHRHRHLCRCLRRYRTRPIDCHCSRNRPRESLHLRRDRIRRGIHMPKLPGRRNCMRRYRYIHPDHRKARRNPNLPNTNLHKPPMRPLGFHCNHSPREEWGHNRNHQPAPDHCTRHRHLTPLRSRPHHHKSRRHQHQPYKTHCTLQAHRKPQHNHPHRHKCHQHRHQQCTFRCKLQSRQECKCSKR